MAGTLEPHPYFMAIIEMYRAANRPAFSEVGAVMARQMLREGALVAKAVEDIDPPASIEDRTIDGPHGDLPLRLYRPANGMGGVVVYFHSGGWVIGDLDTADATCRRLCALSGATLVSVDYRLAPEHPFPVPLDDCYAALQWAASEFDEPIVVAGESAGGNLALGCAIRARASRGVALRGQWLAYPVTDHDFTTRSYSEIGERNWLLSTKDMRWFWDHYCPAGVDRNNPEVSPLRIDDVAGLPPTIILVGQLDPLRDEGLAMANRLATGGVPVTMRCDPAMVHGYLAGAAAVPNAAEALHASAAWIRDRLDCR